METSFNLKLNNYMMNVKNAISSIFSRIFGKSKNSKKKDMKEYSEDICEKNTNNDSNICLKENQKPLKNAEFVNSNKEKSNKNKKSSQSGLIIMALVIIIAIIVIVAVLVGVFVAAMSKTNAGFNIKTVEVTVKTFLVKIFYSVAKWILCFVDIVFSYVKRLCGLNMDFSSLSSIFSAESDMVFNILITAEERATAIFRNLLVLTIIMIVVFTIIALIKAQFEAMRKAKPTSVMETIKKTIRAFVLLLITPFIAIGGIVFSDLLLQTLFHATNTTGAMTLGSQVFSSASVSSNAYRTYAQNNMRIPIVCDFTNEKEILSYYDNVALSDKMSEYLNSSKNMIFMTYLSFVNNEFINYNEINNILDPAKQENRDKAYYGIYDIKVMPEEEKKKDQFSSYRKIENYAEEFYVMGDVVDFAINTGNTLYMKTIEETLDSIINISDKETRDNLFSLMVKQYGLKFYIDASLENEVTEIGTEFINADIYSRKEWELIYYTSYYVSPNDNGEPTFSMQIPYIHVKGQTNEIEGAKYIVAVEKETKDGDVTTNYFEPLTNGYVNRYNKSFNSEFLVNGQIIAAKGTLKDGLYPTAIKRVADEDGSSKLVFYRENMETVAVGAINDIFTGSMASSSNPFQQLFMMIQAFFNPESVMGDLKIDSKAMQTTYNASQEDCSGLLDGRIKLSYFFQFEPTETGYAKGAGTLSFKELFIASSFNIILIVVAPILLVKVCLIAFFGLVQRAYELFLIILTYPAACATIPIDDRAYNEWWKNYLQRLFLTYGLILGLNFVFMLFPIIANLQYFKPHDIATNKVMYKVCTLFFGFLTITQITNLLNATVAILFELVAFTLIESVPKTINQLIMPGAGDLKSDFMEGVKRTLNGVMKTVKVISKMISLALTPIKIMHGQYVQGKVKKGVKKYEDAGKNAQKYMNFKRKLMPGSKFIDQVAKDRTDAQKAKESKKAMQNFKGIMDNIDGGFDGEEPQKPNKSDYGDDEAGKKAYENKMAEYTKAKEAYDKQKKEWQENNDPSKALQGVINAQKAEIASLRTDEEKQHFQRQDAKAEKKLGLYDDTGDAKKDEDKAKQSQKKSDGDDDGNGEGSSDNGSDKYDNRTNFDLWREKRQTKKQYKQSEKRKKILEKRLKNDKKHGRDTSKIEKALDGADAQSKAIKDQFDEIYEARQNRKYEKMEAKKDPEKAAELAAKKAERKANSNVRKKQEGKTFTGRIKRGASYVKEHTVGAAKSYITRRHEEKVRARDEKRKKVFNKVSGNIFQNTHGNIFRIAGNAMQKAGNAMQRSVINHKLNKTFKKSTKKLDKINGQLEELDISSPDYEKQKAKLEEKQKKFEQRRDTTAEQQSSYLSAHQTRQAYYINNQTEQKMKKHDNVAGKRASIKRHFINMTMTSEDFNETSVKKDQTEAEIKQLQAEIEGMGKITTVVEQREKLAKQKQLEKLREQSSKLTSRIQLYENWAEHNNGGFRKQHKKDTRAQKRQYNQEQRLERLGLDNEERQREKDIKKENKERKRRGLPPLPGTTFEDDSSTGSNK